MKRSIHLFVAFMAAGATWGYACVALAAAPRVAFDENTGVLSISGNCSASFVLVAIRRSADGSIWGSSNPPCAGGSYSYEIKVPPEDRTGAVFTVDAIDGGVAPSAAPVSGKADIVFDPAPAPTPAPATIVVDSSPVAPPSGGISFLDATLQDFFGIIAAAGDAVQQFATIVADTVKASVVAANNLFTKTAMILPGGNVVLPSGENQAAGRGVLNSGMIGAFIPDSLVTSSSQIFISPTTPSEFPLTVIEKRDGQGFTVGTVRPQAEAISFDWAIVQTYAATTSGVPEVLPQQVAPPPSLPLPSLPTPEIIPPGGSTTLSVSAVSATGTTAMDSPGAALNTTPDGTSSAPQATAIDAGTATTTP